MFYSAACLPSGPFTAWYRIRAPPTCTMSCERPRAPTRPAGDNCCGAVPPQQMQAVAWYGCVADCSHHARDTCSARSKLVDHRTMQQECNQRMPLRLSACWRQRCRCCGKVAKRRSRRRLSYACTVLHRCAASSAAEGRGPQPDSDPEPDHDTVRGRWRPRRGSEPC